MRAPLSLLCAALAFSGTVAATELSPFVTVLDTDVAVFGAAGLRGQGTGSIAVTGLSGTVNAAYLFWQGPTNDEGDGNAAVTFNGNAILGANIGVTAANGWPFSNSKAYYAAVTGLVAGNGTYALSNFLKAGPPAADVDGVTLLVFFDDGNAANNRDVVVFAGNDSNAANVFDADGWNASLSGINYTSGTVTMRLVVADGQALPDDELKVNGTTLLPSAGSNWQGASLPNQGTAAATGGGLWDHATFDVTAFMTPGLNTLEIQPTLYVNDNVSLIAAIVDSASAPPPPPAPAVTGVSPANGPIAGGTPITISGSNFVAGATVAVGGVAASGAVVVNATTITATTGAHAPGVVDVVVTNPDAQHGSLKSAYLYTAPPVGTNFYTLAPCRIADTRDPIGSLGGPALDPDETRLFAVANICGIPPGAVSISANVTVVPAGSGSLAIWPADGLFLGPSTLSFAAGKTRANNALLLLATDGSGGIKVRNTSASANHVILDVNGYFQ